MLEALITSDNQTEVLAVIDSSPTQELLKLLLLENDIGISILCIAVERESSYMFERLNEKW